MNFSVTFERNTQTAEMIHDVTEAVVPCRDPVDCIVWNMIEEDRPVGNSAEQIEAWVSTVDW